MEFANETDATVNPPKLRVLSLRVGDQPKSVFIALTDEELCVVIESQGDIFPYQKHILLVVDGYTPSASDYADAQQVFAQCYTDIHTGRSE